MNTEEFVGLYIFHTFPVYKEWGLIPIFNVVGVKFNDSSKRRTRWGSVSGIVVIKAELKSMKPRIALPMFSAVWVAMVKASSLN